MKELVDGKEIKNEEEKRGDSRPQQPRGSLRLVLKHADALDMFLMALGTIGCVADGTALAANMLVLGSIMNSYGGSTSAFTHKDINKFALTMFYIAIGAGVGAFLEGFGWARTAERQASRLRSRYLQAVLRQDVGFFDQTEGGSITSQVVLSISTDTLIIQEVLSEKVPNFISNVAAFFSGQLAAFYLCWRLAVIAIPALLLLVIPTLVCGKLLAVTQQRLQEAYADAGGIVEQALSSIRTVYSYVGEQHTVKRFKAALGPTLELGIKQGLLKGMAIGSSGSIYAIWALLGWYGSILVTEKGVSGGNVFSATTCVLNGGVALGTSLMNLKYIAEANVAAASIFQMIRRVPSINSTDKKGKIITDFKGGLEFKNIDFAYPSRPESLVLRNFNLTVIPCQTVGLVGGSGSGKSTVINLLERFYDPLGGEVLSDGINIKTLQLKWLRKQMALVSQEPILFATSIKENILFGKDEASEEEIIRAAKAANAHEFITKLPNGYDTLVGQLGIQMSGGQKQRISIARAMLIDPRILLLDEATSSLDSHSEKAVQDALNQASEGRTTLIVAHRLSALCSADSIAVIHSGQVVEFGPHDELIQNNQGPYLKMLQLHKTLMNDNVISTPNKVEQETSQSLETDAPAENKMNNSTPSLFHHENKTEGVEEENYQPTFWQLLQMTASEWRSTMLGSIGSFCYGLILPVHSFFLGSLLSAYFIQDNSKIKSQTRTYCFAFLALGLSTFISSVIQHYNFGVMGENLTKKVREAIVEKILTFEIEWFDQEDNSTGALCSRLSKDATMVRSLVADRLAFLIQAISGTTLAVIWSLVLGWKLALVVIALQPLMIGAFYVRAIMMRSMSKKILKSQNKSSEVASEAVGNHRVITAFCSQDTVMSLFEDAQKGPKKESRKQSWYAGIGLFTSQFLGSTNTALIFWYGGKLLFDGEISFKRLFETFFIMVATGRVIAQTGSMTMDLSKGTNALNSIFKVLKRNSKMTPDDQDAIIPVKLNGQIELKEVDFFYPTRPQQMILNNFSLMIEAGKVVALVGQSGCGKSTVIRMIERFYDPSKGTVQIDGTDIRLYNLRALRSYIAWVGQEPSLFAGTIYENITYGTENATGAEVIEAATLANAHEFISSMSDGYGTYCGERGVQLSGGQKQRIALARAMLKNPPILLLDEATSALDIKSESLIQDALERTMTSRTCLVVAHRLSTIQKSNKISVVESGRIIEEGSHDELLAKGEKGAYYRLVKLQHQAAVK